MTYHNDGVARGLSYLHSLKKQVRHRGVRSSDILLNEDLNTKLEDFKMARYVPERWETHVNAFIEEAIMRSGAWIDCKFHNHIVFDFLKETYPCITNGFILNACRDTPLIILMVAAAASLVLGIKTERVNLTLFIKSVFGGNILIVCLYVDDLIYTGNDQEMFVVFKKSNFRVYRF
uniref:Probable serine/threonine-protein kinase PIX13 n=1 Tax=Tanacetum cinerariifolium TaxID=118510 RepID=A0A699JYW6_TANCI|nr:probable serine/threonine-protein kinase PIX13 [Tanacetum cinerariifolium]